MVFAESAWTCTTYNDQAADQDGQKDDELGKATHGLFSINKINSRSFVYGTPPMTRPLIGMLTSHNILPPNLHHAPGTNFHQFYNMKLNAEV